MDRIQRSLIAATPAGRAYLERIDAEKARKKRERSRRRSSRSLRAAGATKAARKATKAEARRAVRHLVEERAAGRCEVAGCGGFGLEMDHFWGRAREESVESCWMLCHLCHRMKTNNMPDRIAWLETFRGHAAVNGYVAQVDKCDSALALEHAQHPEANHG